MFPGIYDLQSVVFHDKYLLVRGMGTVGNTIISSEGSYGTNPFRITTGANVFFENIRIRDGTTTSWGSNVFIVNDDSQRQIFFNKCSISMLSGSSHGFAVRSCSSCSPNIIFRNTDIFRGYNTVGGSTSGNYNRGNTYHQYTYTPSYNCWRCTSHSYAENNRVTTPTENYGQNYGDFLIKFTCENLDGYFDDDSC